MPGIKPLSGPPTSKYSVWVRKLTARISSSLRGTRPTQANSTVSRGEPLPTSNLPKISVGERFDPHTSERRSVNLEKVFIERPSVQPWAREFIEARIKAPQPDMWYHINGEAGTGKTCLLRMLEREYFRDSRVSTIFISADLKGLEELEKAAKQNQQADKQLIIFVDTLDYFISTVESTRLCQVLHQLTKGNAILITTSRSFEFSLFSNKMRDYLPLRTSSPLGKFNLDEMQYALEKYINVFYFGHPDVKAIIESIARNKSLKELCETPLYMMMIFEAYTLEEIISPGILTHKNFMTSTGE